MTAPRLSSFDTSHLLTLPPKLLPTHRILVMTDDREGRMINTPVSINFRSAADIALEIAAAWRALTLGSTDSLHMEKSLSKVAGMTLLRKLRVIRLALPFILATGVLPKDGDSPGKSGGRKSRFPTSGGPVRNCLEPWQNRSV